MVKELPPSAASMIMALRAFGYTPESAIADIIDNSIKANARNYFPQHQCLSNLSMEKIPTK